jgi:hypothetical protein
VPGRRRLPDRPEPADHHALPHPRGRRPGEPRLGADRRAWLRSPAPASNTTAAPGEDGGGIVRLSASHRSMRLRRGPTTDGYEERLLLRPGPIPPTPLAGRVAPGSGWGLGIGPDREHDLQLDVNRMLQGPPLRDARAAGRRHPLQFSCAGPSNLIWVMSGRGRSIDGRRVSRRQELPPIARVECPNPIWHGTRFDAVFAISSCRACTVR